MLASTCTLFAVGATDGPGAAHKPLPLALAPPALPWVQQIVNNNIDELEKEMLAFGRPIGDDAGSQLYQVLEMSRAFYDNFQDHLDGRKPGGERITSVFEDKLPAALMKLPFDKYLSLQSECPSPSWE